MCWAELLYCHGLYAEDLPCKAGQIFRNALRHREAPRKRTIYSRCPGRAANGDKPAVTVTPRRGSDLVAHIRPFVEDGAAAGHLFSGPAHCTSQRYVTIANGKLASYPRKDGDGRRGARGPSRSSRPGGSGGTGFANWSGRPDLALRSGRTCRTSWPQLLEDVVDKTALLRDAARGIQRLIRTILRCSVWRCCFLAFTLFFL
jgi:hypothetical protein